MKTLVVLSTLVGLALSAPALQDSLQHGSKPNRIQSGFQNLETPVGMHPHAFKPEINGPSISARSHHGHSNPVIVKNKNGYHVYRDSTEERAATGPNVNCGKQVRVKLCDDAAAKSSDLRRSTNDDLLLAPKDDVHDSIKLAKEAVESLQRDLKNIEHDTSGKSAQWKHGRSDKALHEDIEAARIALEQAQMKQRTFGNLESMNLHAATMRDSDALHKTAKTKIEEAKLVQWKEAMENIQRNVEIARNIEDSIRASEPSLDFLNTDGMDTTKFMRSDNHENKDNLHKIEETMKILVSENHQIAGKAAEEDMKPSASEIHQSIHEIHDEHLHNSETQAKMAQLAPNVKTPLVDPMLHNNNHQHTKGSGVHVDASLRSAHKDHKMPAHDMSIATNMMHPDSRHKGTINKEMPFKAAETHHHHVPARGETSNMKKHFETHSFNGHQHHKTMLGAKTVATQRESETSDIKLKEATILKSAETTLELNDKIIHEQDKLHASASGLNSGLSMKSAENTKEHIQNSNDAEEIVKKSNTALHSEMKLADNAELASDINLNVHLNHDIHKNINHDIDPKLGKSVELPKESETEQARVVGFKKLVHVEHDHGHGHHEHGHHVQVHHGHGHGGHIQHGYGHHHGYIQHGHGKFGKASEFDMDMHPSEQIDMKDFLGKSAMENMMQWKHHDAARSSYGLGAYGAGGGSGAGGSAVGVFPHAKVGGCAIPLLLSCSPSVTSGSLAKSHGYGGHGYGAQEAPAAPSYRNNDDSKFVNKNKRDIIKTKESSIKHVKDVVKPVTKILEKAL